MKWFIVHLPQADTLPSIPKLSPVEDWWSEKPQNCWRDLQLFQAGTHFPLQDELTFVREINAKLTAKCCEQANIN